MGTSASPATKKRTISFASSFASLPSSISGFTVIPVAYSSATHVLYVRAHSTPKSRDPKGKHKLPGGRTLFLVNVPPDATERELTILFKSCGTVEKVIFNTGGGTGAQPQTDGDESSDEDGGGEGEGDEEDSNSVEDEDGDGDRPKKKRKISEPEGPQVVPLPPIPLRTLRHTGHTAYVVFLDSSSLARALKPPQKPCIWPRDPETPLGLAHYVALQSALRPPLDVVRAHADSWMEAFEFEQAKKRQQSKYRKGEAIVDEDGFTLVTRGGAYGKTLGGGVGVASKQFIKDQKNAGKRNRKKGKNEQDVFYAFQIHEKKRKEIIDLKKGFEQDKANIEKLKQARKFRPY